MSKYKKHASLVIKVNLEIRLQIWRHRVKITCGQRGAHKFKRCAGKIFLEGISNKKCEFL